MTIPRMDGPQVRATPEQSRLAPLASYTKGADALGTVGQGLAAVADVAQKARDAFDEIRVNEAEAQLQADADRLWADPREGFANQQGTDAVQGFDGFRDRLHTAIGDREGALTTERQKALFRARAERIRRSLDLRASDHVAGAVRAVDDQSHQALMASDMNALMDAARVGDGAGVTDTIRRMSERMAMKGDRDGAAPEAIRQARVELVSQGRMAQVGALVDAGRVDAAQAIFDQFKGELTAQDRAKVEGPLAEARERQAVVGTAERILSALDANPDASTETMLRDVPLEVRPDVRKYVNAEISAREQEAKRVHDEAVLDAANRVESGKGKPARMVVDPQVWATFSVSERQALQRLADEFTNPDGPKDDTSAWLDFFTMAPADRAKLTRAEFVTKFYSKFDRGHRERAERMWTEGQSGTGGAAGLMSPGRRLERTYQQVFQEDVDKKSWDADQFAAYESAVDARVMEASAAKGGKPLTDTELDALMTSVAVQMTTRPAPASGDGWGAAVGAMAKRARWSLADQYGVPAREEAPVAPPSVPYAAVPPVARDTIVRQLREQGRAATPERVGRAFTALALGDTVRYNAEVGVPITPEAVRALTMGGFPRASAPDSVAPWRKP